ncbi:uncharacterized protein LOC132312373 [Cornus florida]|uniref:uncharacterized protein LOC132312373 n=1 Tax=Cornus florida TaxID=4283 RepID=UPI00289E33FA|nr:uncharacterized protein LOC132312373 [Cornus florida]
MAMDDDASVKRGNGRLPEFGAIFMSNRRTMGECFERKLFGLPSSCADVVKKVRAGMLLFLFEYEERELHGVFQAISDGSMNIVPNAYASSGKYFSAQVRFSVIWNCRPLYENEFRDAIRDNYYAPNKFNFGLSKDQVYRLLWLFVCRKVRVQKFIGEKKVKRRHHESSDEVNSLVESGKLGLGNDRPMVGNLPRLSSIVVCSRDADFRHPIMLRTNSEVSDLSVPLQRKQEHADFSSSSSSSILGDFIPLSSPEDSDPTEMRNSSEVDEDLESNQIESSMSYCHEDSSFSESDIDASHFGHTALNHPSVAFWSDRGPYDGNYQSNPVHQSDNHPCVKGLYSDTPKQRTSVFSRLNLVSEAAPRENEDTSKLENSRLNLVSEAAALENDATSKLENSVHEIMKKLQQRHDNWTKTRKAKYSSREKEGNAQNKRGSVFSRLDFASKGTVQDKEFNAKANQSRHNIKKDLRWKKKSRGREVFIRNNDDGKSLSVTVQLEMIEGASQAEKHPKDTWSRGRMEEEIPLLNLKRKGEMLKMQCKTEGKDCIDGMGVCLSEEQLKKRKLVKPIFGNKSSDAQTKVCDSCLNVETSQESSAGKKSSGSFEVSTRNESVDDNENRLSEKDNGEEGKGLIGKDAKLQEQGIAVNSSLPVAATGSLKTYQRRRGLSASPRIKDPDQEITVGEENAECHMTFICTGGGEKLEEQIIDHQVEVCAFNAKTTMSSAEGLGDDEYKVE